MTALVVPIPQLLVDLVQAAFAGDTSLSLIAPPFLEVVPEQDTRKLNMAGTVGVTFGHRGGAVVEANNRAQPQNQLIELAVHGRVSQNVRLADGLMFEVLRNESRVLGLTGPDSDYVRATQLFAIRRTVSFSVI